MSEVMYHKVVRFNWFQLDFKTFSAEKFGISETATSYLMSFTEWNLKADTTLANKFFKPNYMKSN